MSSKSHVSEPRDNFEKNCRFRLDSCSYKALFSVEFHPLCGSNEVIKTNCSYIVKLIHSEKGTKFCEISTLFLTGTTKDKSKVEISQNFVAFSEYVNFT